MVLKEVMNAQSVKIESKECFLWLMLVSDSIRNVF